MSQPPVDDVRKKKATTVLDPISQCVEAVNAFHSKAILAEKQAHERIAAAVENAFQAGLALIKLKSLVKHGDWAVTIEKKCAGISQRTAARYMKLANEFRDRPHELPQRPLRELYSSSEAKDASSTGTKGKSETAKTRSKTAGHAREINRLKIFLKADNRGSLVSQMTVSDREEFIGLLRELIVLLSENSA